VMLKQPKEGLDNDTLPTIHALNAGNRSEE